VRLAAACSQSWLKLEPGPLPARSSTLVTWPIGAGYYLNIDRAEPGPARAGLDLVRLRTRSATAVISLRTPVGDGGDLGALSEPAAGERRSRDAAWRAPV
jgi:hypothetical protein